MQPQPKKVTLLFLTNPLWKLRSCHAPRFWKFGSRFNKFLACWKLPLDSIIYKIIAPKIYLKSQNNSITWWKGGCKKGVNWSRNSAILWERKVHNALHGCSHEYSLVSSTCCATITNCKLLSVKASTTILQVFWRFQGM